MANFNKVILVGRLTADPEIRTTGSGLKLAAIRFAVTNRKKNNQTGQWEDEPMYVDVTAFDRNDGGGNASTVERFCKKGSQLMIEGKLQFETWEDKNGGGKRSKHKIVADTIQLLDSKGSTPGGGGGGGDEEEMDSPPPPRNMSRSAPPPPNRPQPPAARPPAGRAPAKPPADDYDNGGGEGDIPF